MKFFICSIACCLLLAFAACGQVTTGNNAQKNIKGKQVMDTKMITHPVVKKAIEALQTADKKTWFSLFTNKAQLFDDGNAMDLKAFFEKALGHERFTSIDKVENGGLHLYGKFHSDQWGDFKTYFKFKVNEAGQISRLDIGQASY